MIKRLQSPLKKANKHHQDVRSFKVTKEYKNSRFDRYFKIIFKIYPSITWKTYRKNNFSKWLEIQVHIQDNKKITEGFYQQEKNTIFSPSSLEVKNYEKIILHNNENFIVINKPCGIAVQSGTKSFKNIFDLLKNTIRYRQSDLHSS